MSRRRPAPTQGPHLGMRSPARARGTLGGMMATLWAAFTVLTFVSFAGQAYVMQTHEVVAQFETGGHDVTEVGTGKKAPSPHNSANCPLCQTIAVAGAYLIPAAADLPLPADAAIRTERLRVVRSAVAASESHIWLGRAPPLA